MKYFLFFLVTLSFSHQSEAKAKGTSFCKLELERFNECTTYNPKKACGEKVINTYTGSLNKPLNLALRGLSKDLECLEVAKALKEILLDMTPIKAPVYRGSKSIVELKDAVEGDCYQTPSFLSTSLSMETGLNFKSHEEFTFLTIHTTTGVDISNLSQVRLEKEVLLLPGIWLKIVRREEVYEGNEIEFQEVEEAKCLSAKIRAPML